MFAIIVGGSQEKSSKIVNFLSMFPVVQAARLQAQKQASRPHNEAKIVKSCVDC
jgi:hypothetical protein